MIHSSVQNKNIVVTRAKHQAPTLSNRLKAIGANPILFPCIAIAPPEDTTDLDRHLGRLDAFFWLILTSPNTVRSIAERLSHLSHQPDWTTTKIAVVGSKTAQIVKGILRRDVDFMPTDFTASALGESLPDVLGKKIFLPQSELADDSLAQMLTQRGAEVITVEAYRNIIGAGGDDVPTMLQQNQIDMVTFTSSSTVENFLKRIKPQTASHIPALCIGPSTAETATTCGFRHILVPDEYTLDGMIATLVHYFAQS